MDGLPILDDHMHLDRRGRFLAAAREFARSGGTHIILVSKPPSTIDIKIAKPDDYREVFDETLTIAERVRETGIGVFVILGVHPAEITRLTRERGLENAVEMMKDGLRIAGGYVEEGLAIGLKSGRPHYPVPEDVWRGSNQIMEHAMILAKELDCALQLHTEETSEKGLREIKEMMKRSGIPPDRTVKHYASPLLKEFERAEIYPSIIAREKNIEEALQNGTRFMMETDYIDDPSRPGVVLGPRTVPKRTNKLIKTHGTEPFYRVHKENPEKVYQIEIDL